MKRRDSSLIVGMKSRDNECDRKTAGDALSFDALEEYRDEWICNLSSSSFGHLSMYGGIAHHDDGMHEMCGRARSQFNASI